MVKSVLFSKQKEKEKEKEKDKEKEELLLKKRLEPDIPRKEVDMVKLKKKVNEIMNSICDSSNSEIKDNMDYLYQSMHKSYILNEFNSNCLNYINKIILDAKKNNLQKYQGIFELNKLFIAIIKELLMNEFELLLFSLYLESVDISLYSDIFTFEESFTFLCFFIKKLTLAPEKLSPINSFLIRKYQGFEDKFNKWFQLNSSIFNNKLYFSYTEINKRFKEYNSSYSIYCKNNYIDYNLIIDRILTMSIPYNEGKNDNLFVDKKDDSSDLLGNNINNNLNINSIKSFGESKNNINNIFFSSNGNYTNNDNSKKININSFYNNSYITGLPSGIFNTKKLNNINFDYLLNRNNIIFNSINNKKNNEKKFNTELINKEVVEPKQNEPANKKGINFKVTNNYNEEKNKNNPLNNKFLFVVEEDKKKEETNIINNNETSNSSQSQKNNINKNKDNKKEVSITPNNLLYSLENIDEEPQNNKVGNNIQINLTSKNPNIFNNNLSNNNINNFKNIIIRKNEFINNNPNNLNGYLSSQQINDYNNLRYNSNLGLNQFNNPSQGSFTLERNQYYNDLSNFYHNSIHGIEQEDNLRQLINQSNENLFRSCLSLNHSSKFLYPILPVNYENNNNIAVDPSINNLINQPIVQALPFNPHILHFNNNITTGKDNTTMEKKNDDNNN